MKKYLIALSAFSIMAVAANAQSKVNSSDTGSHRYGIHHHGYGGHRHHHAGMMHLNLTDTQKQQLKDLNTTYRNQVKDLEKNESITLKDYRSKKTALEAERKSAFRAILTDEQKNTIAQSRKQTGEKMKIRSKERLEKMKADLNLTDEQASKIMEQRNNTLAQAKAIRENASLSEDQKKEQLVSLRKSSHESMKNILTAEQLKKKEEMRNSRMNDMKNKRANKDS